MDEHFTKYEIDEALTKLTFHEGYTNTSGALRLMRTQVYKSKGDRLASQDIAICKLMG